MNFLRLYEDFDWRWLVNILTFAIDLAAVASICLTLIVGVIQHHFYPTPFTEAMRGNIWTLLGFFVGGGWMLVRHLSPSNHISQNMFDAVLGLALLSVGITGLFLVSVQDNWPHWITMCLAIVGTSVILATCGLYLKLRISPA